MEIKKLEAAIEAILFTMGESVELSQIADAIQQDKETTRKIIQNMMDKYQKKDRGIQIRADKQVIFRHELFLRVSFLFQRMVLHILCAWRYRFP